MDCLTDEQLAGHALGLADDEQVAEHVAQCIACRAKLDGLARLTQHILALHTEFDRTHAASRARLLSKLSTVEVIPRAAGAWAWFAQQVEKLTTMQRFAAGGVGLTTLIGLALLFLIWNSAERLSAMERMVKQLREVTSFSFELEETSDRITGENRRRIQRNDTNFWRAPASWHGTTKMVKLPLPPAPGDVGELLEDVEEIYSPGQRGILIDHKRQTFFRTPEMQPDSFPDYSPVNWVQRMSKGNVKVIGDLGTKELHGKTAHGYVVSLGHPEPDSSQNAVHLWVDAETDLPIEFRCEERYEDDDPSDGNETWTNVMRVYNCQWNINLDAVSFDAVAPAGYDDTSFPTDAKTIDGIVQALRLYAELSGGHYPQPKEFHGEDIHDEMLRLCGFTGPPQPEWNDDKRYRQIQDTKAGIDELARVLRNKHHTGYYGTEVGPADKDKILVWWPVDIEDFYFAIYGDLRTANLRLAEWAQLVPPELAESHTPVKYSKPDAGR